MTANVLITNDDGIHAQGLWALEKALGHEYQITVVAPDAERSAVSHSITLARPLRVDRIQTNGGWGYAVNGTPADCVKLAVLEILDAPPQLGRLRDQPRAQCWRERQLFWNGVRSQGSRPHGNSSHSHFPGPQSRQR